MKVIVGLGNPGREYRNNRHNVGYRVIEQLAVRWSIGLDREKHHGRFGGGSVGNERVVLLQPLTFMNKSGVAVAEAMQFYKTPLSDLMVVVDDMALPLAQLRLRAGGSAGGHNGLQDIIDRLGSNGFNRLRVGIDAPAGSGAIDYVLGDFSETEAEAMADVLPMAADAVACWLTDGISEAMTRYNQRPKQEDTTETENETTNES